jgi:predicted nucleic acid-binding protein
MSFLLDADICSAYLKDDLVVVGRVMLHYGGLNVSVITVGELLTWALRAHAPAHRMKEIQDLLKGATVLDVTHRSGHESVPRWM